MVLAALIGRGYTIFAIELALINPERTTMIKAMAHICILTQDPDKTEWFYCSCLGMVKKFNFIREGKIAGFYLQINDRNFIEVFQTDTAASAQESPIKHFCLETDNIDDVTEKTRELNVDVTDKKMGCDHTWQAWLTDPNGIGIELHQYTDTSCQTTGGDCIINY